MKKSNIITVAICAFLLVAGGGVGAYAADQINGDTVADNTLDGGEIQNESLTGSDVDNGTLTGADIKNQTLSTNDIAAGSVNDALIANGAVDGGEVRDETLTGHDLKDATVEWQDLAPGVADSLFQNYVVPDTNGAQSGRWVSAGKDLNSYSDSTFNLGAGQYLVVLDVTSNADVPVRVSLQGAGTQTFCIAVPVEGFSGSTCSITHRFENGYAFDVTASLAGASPDLVSIEATAIKVG